MRNIFKRRSDLEKLTDIVLESWRELAENIAKGRIPIHKEDKLKIELGFILRARGIEVLPEESVVLSKSTQKTPNQKADIDLLVELGSCRAAIELKWPHDHMPKDYRIYILNDIENLEVYLEDGKADIGFELVYTKESSYMNDNHEVKIHNTGYYTNGFTFNNDQDCFITIIVEK